MTEFEPRVLVLDEDLLSLELYARELSSNYRVITRESVQETRRLLKEQLLDVVIMEPAINQGEGWELLREIRTHSNPPLVILCSVEDDRQAGLQQGAFAYLVKPVLPTTLHALLDDITARKSYQSA